jgi:hypothetical protein
VPVSAYSAPKSTDHHSSTAPLDAHQLVVLLESLPLEAGLSLRLLDAVAVLSCATLLLLVAPEPPEVATLLPEAAEPADPPKPPEPPSPEVPPVEDPPEPVVVTSRRTAMTAGFEWGSAFQAPLKETVRVPPGQMTLLYVAGLSVTTEPDVVATPSHGPAVMAELVN